MEVEPSKAALSSQADSPQSLGKRLQKAAVFVLTAYLLSGLLFGSYFGLGGVWKMPGALILSVAYMFMPLTAAILVQKVLYRSPLREPLRFYFKPSRWFVAAWLVPVAISGATITVAVLLPDVALSTSIDAMLDRFKNVLTPEQLEQMRQQTESLPLHPFWIAMIQGLIAGPTINAIAAFGEEAGWRGLLQREFGTVRLLEVIARDRRHLGILARPSHPPRAQLSRPSRCRRIHDDCNDDAVVARHGLCDDASKLGHRRRRFSRHV